MNGIILGDGRIDYPDKYGHYRLRVFDADKEFLEMLRYNILWQQYRLQANIFWDGSCWYISIYGKKNIKHFYESIINKNKLRYTLDFIRGFFDAEGSVYIGVAKRGKKYLTISLTNKDRSVLEYIKDTLEKYGIYSSIVKKNIFR